jgi:hypothetical protein
MTMRVTRWVLGLAGAALIAWGSYRAMAVYGLYRAATDCSNEILNEAASSDGKLTATAFERNCGATAPFVRIVCVRATNAAFDGDAEKEYVFVVEGQPELQVAWNGPDHLSVRFGGGGRVVRQALIWYGVTVAYD